VLGGDDTADEPRYVGMVVDELPLIDVGPLVGGPGGDPRAVGAAIDAACREVGFFAVTGHGVAPDLLQRLEDGARRLFALPVEAKGMVSMARGGRAWRGWFPLGGELTSGEADAKEGFYLGSELGPDDPQVRAGVPLHGPNLFPAEVPELRATVLEYLDELTRLGHALMEGMALGLGLDTGWFARHLTGDPVVMLRFFRYPPSRELGDDHWGVGEHTDYGLLTILHQDRVGGLEVHRPGGWTRVPPRPGAFVCNLGDMLERLTRGRYRSTPHRVRNEGDVNRLSFPFFFDPAWDAEVVPIPLEDAPPAPARPRWDGADLTTVSGTYGDYLLGKVRRVFPELFATAVGEVPDPG
jgi:isopenicillin N synthase-like dioxygenase